MQNSSGLRITECTTSSRAVVPTRDSIWEDYWGFTVNWKWGAQKSSVGKQSESQSELWIFLFSAQKGIWESSSIKSQLAVYSSSAWQHHHNNERITHPVVTTMPDNFPPIWKIVVFELTLLLHIVLWRQWQSGNWFKIFRAWDMEWESGFDCKSVWTSAMQWESDQGWWSCTVSLQHCWLKAAYSLLYQPLDLALLKAVHSLWSL